MMRMSDELWGIVYVSAASQAFSVEEMAAVRREIKTDCASKQITGIIIYARGNVLCYMEGNKEVVKDQYKQVLRDVRHKNLVKLYDNAISYRYFEDLGMTMHFVSSKDFSSLDDFAREANATYLHECLQMDEMVMKLMAQFLINNK